MASKVNHPQTLSWHPDVAPKHVKPVTTHPKQFHANPKSQHSLHRRGPSILGPHATVSPSFGTACRRPRTGSQSPRVVGRKRAARLQSRPARRQSPERPRPGAPAAPAASAAGMHSTAPPVQSSPSFKLLQLHRPHTKGSHLATTCPAKVQG